MSADCVGAAPSIAVPVFATKFARGWPEHAAGEPAKYVPLGDALTTQHDSDAHVACYSVPEIARRLAGEFVFAEIDLGVPMVLFVVDVDDGLKKALEGLPEDEAQAKRAEWWKAEREKIDSLLADHEGGFIYRTRGGYRIVYQLESAFVLMSTTDASRWKATYLAWLEHVESHYGIRGDRSCHDWTRLYRLPRVVRDGDRQELEVIGDPAAIGSWNVEVEIPEPPAPKPRARPSAYVPKPGDFDIYEFMAERYPGVPTYDRIGGRVCWDIECPWEHEHSDKAKRDTVVSYSDSDGPGFSCLHNHCKDLRHWKEFRRWHQPEWVPFDERVPLTVEQKASHIIEQKRRQQERELRDPAAPEDAHPKPAAEQQRAQLAVDVARADAPPIRSYPTGNLQLDNLLGGGLNTREMCVVMGPPGGCKTAWGISTALALEPTLPTLYASTELEGQELMARVAANVLRKSWGGIRRGAVDRELVIRSLQDRRIYLLGCDVLPRDGDAALAMIEREAVAIRATHGVTPAIVIDYLQDLARGSDREARTLVGDRATQLRILSQRLDCPVVAISSVARTFYSLRKAKEFREADDPTVYLAAAKESGDVDYAAARVLFLDAEDDRDKPERAVRIAVAKSRDARTGFAGARVTGECGRFVAAPEVLGEMAASGRGDVETSSDWTNVDDAILKRVAREHAEGRGALCTRRYLREGNRLGKIKIGKERAESGLDRLVEAGRLQLCPVERTEGGKSKVRDIYTPVIR